MAVLCFGGSFNPIHNGHLICARSVAESAGYDRIALIPTGQPPHKAVSSDIAPARARLEMCQLATVGSSLFQTEDLEIFRDGPSYTLETVRILASRGWGRVHWLIGADMLLYLPQWHRARELVEEVEFVIMARPGWQLDWETLPPEFRQLRDRVVEVPQIQISATVLRQRVAAGLSINYLTPEPVCAYIRDHRLYQSIP